jgi:uncharacterized protein YcnI
LIIGCWENWATGGLLGAGAARTTKNPARCPARVQHFDDDNFTTTYRTGMEGPAVEKNLWVTRMRTQLLVSAILFTSLPVAHAHITAQPNEAPAGVYFQTAFTVPHGCGSEPTVAVRVKIPDGVISVKPQMKPGWEVSIKTRKLDKPIDAGHGQSISETVDEIRWQGGPLPHTHYDTFGLVMKLPEMPGQTLYFPFVQECRQGVHRWIGIPAAGQKWNDVREPAPFIRLKPSAP